MLNQPEDAAVLEKTRQLCQTILEQPALATARRSVDAFMGDAKTRAQYEEVLSKGHDLQHRQQSGARLAPEEVAAFEQSRDQLLANPVACSFMEAQEQMRRVHHGVTEFVSKTLELGRLPAAEDFHSECCGEGGGCGCDH